jgi:hypothetical protein
MKGQTVPFGCSVYRLRRRSRYRNGDNKEHRKNYDAAPSEVWKTTIYAFK